MTMTTVGGDPSASRSSLLPRDAFRAAPLARLSAPYFPLFATAHVTPSLRFVVIAHFINNPARVNCSFSRLFARSFPPSFRSYLRYCHRRTVACVAAPRAPFYADADADARFHVASSHEAKKRARLSINRLCYAARHYRAL